MLMDWVDTSLYYRKQEQAQLTFTCSRSAMESLEKGMKYVQS